MAQRGRVPNPEPHSRARQPKSPGHPPSRARAHTHRRARARASVSAPCCEYCAVPTLRQVPGIGVPLHHPCPKHVVSGDQGLGKG